MTMTVVKYGLKFSEGALRSNVQIKSHGISRVFPEYTAKAEAESQASGKSSAPVRFHMVCEKEDRKRETTLEWQDGGSIDYSPRHYAESRTTTLEPVPPRKSRKNLNGYGQLQTVSAYEAFTPICE